MGDPFGIPADAVRLARIASNSGWTGSAIPVPAVAIFSWRPRSLAMPYSQPLVELSMPARK
jgi:hypothetical protein